MVYGSLLAEEDVMAPEAQKAVDSWATQLRAVALYFVSGIHTPLAQRTDHSRELRATALRRCACRPA
jgi:hypothetical protein